MSETKVVVSDGNGSAVASCIYTPTDGDTFSVSATGTTREAALVALVEMLADSEAISAHRRRAAERQAGTWRKAYWDMVDASKRATS